MPAVAPRTVTRVADAQVERLYLPVSGEPGGGDAAGGDATGLWPAERGSPVVQSPDIAPFARSAGVESSSLVGPGRSDTVTPSIARAADSAQTVAVADALWRCGARLTGGAEPGYRALRA